MLPLAAACLLCGALSYSSASAQTLCSHYKLTLAECRRDTSCTYSSGKVRPQKTLTIRRTNSSQSETTHYLSNDQKLTTVDQLAFSYNSSKKLTYKELMLAGLILPRAHCQRCYGQGRHSVSRFNRCTNCEGTGGPKIDPCWFCQGAGAFKCGEVVVDCRSCFVSTSDTQSDSCPPLGDVSTSTTRFEPPQSKPSTLLHNEIVGDRHRNYGSGTGRDSCGGRGGCTDH